jgi:ApaG protein
MSDATTKGVRVQVRAVYVPERSRPDDQQYFFAYRVRISNVGSDVVQLVTRHWIITNADGKTEEVKGPGVIGETPVLEPGDAFEYSSACPLDTPVGAMHGSYQMVYKEGAEPGFDAVIAPFTLAVPGSLH